MNRNAPGGFVMALLLAAQVALVVWVMGVLAAIEVNGPNLQARLSPPWVVAAALILILALAAIFLFARAPRK